MPIKTRPLLSESHREHLEYALRPDTGTGVGGIHLDAPHETSEGVEFEIGNVGGIYVGTVPYSGESPIELPYSEDIQSAEGILYVYIADLDAQKRDTGGERAATYAAMRYESEVFRALSEELRSLVREAFAIDEIDETRFERYNAAKDSGAYFVLPLRAEWI